MPGFLAELRNAASTSALMDEPAIGRLSEEARAFLAKDAALLELNPVTLCFKSPGMEGAFMAQVAKQRWPVLVAIFAFDCLCYTLRLGARAMRHGPMGVVGMVGDIAWQLANMAGLHLLTFWINWRSRRRPTHQQAAQEEFLLSFVMAAAITNLLLSLPQERAHDYVFASFFLICTASLLKIRWVTGCAILSMPLLAMWVGAGRWGFQNLPRDAGVQLVVAWATGALMSYLADSYRRQMFANQQLARAAAEKEIEEARARSAAQHALAAAQQQAAQRALTVASEKAANEAKSEFMSLMCHEVRTPLNGCLASAEMLLESELQVEQRELAKTIRVSGSILLSTVSNFLDFFKMEAGKQLDIVRTDMDLQEIVNDVHCVVEAMIGRSSDVCLLPPTLYCVPDLVLGDPDRLKGILLNLCTNAAKFTKRGAIALRVSVTGPDFRPKPHTADTFQGMRLPRGVPSPASHASSTPAPPGSMGLMEAGRAYTTSLSTVDATVLRNSLQLLVTERELEAAAAGTASAAGGLARQSPPSPHAAPHRHSTGHMTTPPIDFLSSSLYSGPPDLPPTSAALTPAQLARIAADRPTTAVRHPSIEATVATPTSVREGGLAALTVTLFERVASVPPLLGALARTVSTSSPSSPTGAEGPKTPRQTGCDAPTSSALTPLAVGDWHAVGTSSETLRKKRSMDRPPRPPPTEDGEGRRPSVSVPSPPQEDADARRQSISASSDGSSVGAQSLSSNAPSTPEMGLSDAEPARLQGSACTSLAESLTGPISAVPLAGRQDACDMTSSGSSGDESVSSVPQPPDVPHNAAALPPSLASPEMMGWHSVVSRSGGNVSTTSVQLESKGHTGGQWLVFEVSDTGCGIAREGLRSLFQEYVQGTEDEMRRPRTRGGTGLGLSICSKQVAVLGGHIGAMSKIGDGTTFWFTIPLIRPPESARNPSPEVRRRTASWGSRDAFTDGHIPGAAPGGGGGVQLLNKGLTSRVHAFRKLYNTPGRIQRASSLQDLALAYTQFEKMRERVADNPVTEAVYRAAEDERYRRRSAPGPSSVNPFPELSAAEFSAQRAAGLEPAPSTPRHSTQLMPSQGGTSGRPAEALFASSAARKPASMEVRIGTGLPTATLEPLAGPGRGVRGPAAAGAAPGGSASRFAAALARGAQAPRPLLEDQEEDASKPATLGGVFGAHAMGPGVALNGGLSSVLSGAAAPGSGGLSPDGMGARAAGAPAARRAAAMRPSMELRRRKLDTSVLQGRRVLLAEDNLINQTVAKKMLQSLGLVCEVASNGQEAVDLARAAADARRQFDVILMDMSMPLMGGVEATRVIRRAGLDVPIVAMTANASDRDRDECLVAGMDGFLSKPVLKERLAEAIMLVMSGRAQYQDSTILLKPFEKL